MSDHFFDGVAECAVLLNPPVADRVSMICSMIDATIEAGLFPALLRQEATDAVLRREQIEGTVLPDGMSFPHGRMEGIERVAIALGIHREGLDLGAPDGQLTRFTLLMLVPANAGAGYVQLLARFSRKMMMPACRERLLAAVSAEEVRQILVS